MTTTSTRGITVTIERNELGRLTSKLRSDVADMTEGTAKAIVTDAQTRVPYVTGHLHDSIKARPEGIGWLVEATEDYAGFVEYGTRYMSAQPYLTPAAEAQRSPYLGRLQKALRALG